MTAASGGGKIKNGFTLIELLVVISIIAFLASAALVVLNSARIKARDAKRLADLKQIKTALDLYAQDNGGSYPGNCGTYWWIDDNNFSGSSGYPPCATSGGLAPYFSNICAVYGPNGGKGADGYAYTLKSDGTYKLGAKFELSANQTTNFSYGCSGQTNVGAWYESH